MNLLNFFVVGFGSYTDDQGCFSPEENMPLLARRFKYIQTIGKGQSSVLIQAEDSFSNGPQVSIKVLHAHYSMLGAQEMDCLRRLNQADPLCVSATLRLYVSTFNLTVFSKYIDFNCFYAHMAAETITSQFTL